ncbi:MAG TPA: HAD-IA family hydrolase [Polyangiaceae bacterium]|nr:HAD-IA family hydrolase [Polyangiaceae bacterium]
MTWSGANHLIFDMDGVLLDTEPLYTQAYDAVLEPYGHRLDWETKKAIMGRPAPVSTRHVIEKFGLPLTPDEFIQRRKPLLEGLFRHSPAMPGAEDFVRRQKAAGKRLAVATSTYRPLFQIKTSGHPWFELFDTVICGDDPAVARPKPAPDIFLLAAERLGAAPTDCVVFEDSPAGVEAAVASGAHVIGLLDPNMDRALYVGAHRLIESWAELG